jgi:RHS repeat-associated protein
MKDWIGGEEVNYTYDALSRLSAAWTTGPEWGQSYSYDGFGNRTAATVTKGTAPSSSLAFDPATNRIVGYYYDANGNLGGSGYDVQNRLVQSGWELYGYAPDNQRVWKQVSSYGQVTEEGVHFYGVDGRRLGVYQFYAWEGENGPAAQTLREYVYFGGKLLYEGLPWEPRGVLTDRLGSVRVRTLGTLEQFNYYPWGEERGTTTAQNRDKFATYFRDGTGSDYAQNRYYESTLGRFRTPDPYRASAALRNPQTWNRYAYVHGDPVNFADTLGLFEQTVGCGAPGTEYCLDAGDTSGYGERGFLGYDPEGGGAVYSPLPVGLAGPSVVPGDATGDGSGRPVDTVTDQQARGRLGERLANFASSNCAKVFGSVIEDYTTNDFVSYVNTTEFYAARSASYANLTQNQVVANGVQTTLNNSVPSGTDAVTIWGPGGNAVLLGGNYFSGTTLSQQNTLAHELLHAYTHWSDAEVFDAFKNHGLAHVNYGTGDITEWLQNDCKKP